MRLKVKVEEERKEEVEEFTLRDQLEEVVG